MRARLQAGFTLIEVMIVVAIVAILTSIALPMYTDYIRTGAVTEGLANLSAQRIRMEQYFQDHRNYDNACGSAVVPTLNPTKYFTYGCNASGATYSLSATGQGAVSNFVYSVNQAGTRATTLPSVGWDSTRAASCWIIKKDGTCSS